ELLHQVASLYEDAAGDLNQAFLTYARALAEDPANADTQSNIDRVARATGRFADLAQVYEGLSGKIEDAQLASGLLMMAARVHENDLGNNDAAVALYRRVLETDPLSLEAAQSLERIFRTTEQYAQLSRILQRKAEILDEPAHNKAALIQTAAVDEDVLEKPESAIPVSIKDT